MAIAALNVRAVVYEKALSSSTASPIGRADDASCSQEGVRSALLSRCRFRGHAGHSLW